MSIYKKNEWIDHIEDIETGELLQEGTLYCARLMNNMEDGIYDAHIEIIDIFNRLFDFYPTYTLFLHLFYSFLTAFSAIMSQMRQKRPRREPSEALKISVYSE